MYYCGRSKEPSDLAGLGIDPITAIAAGSGILGPLVSSILPESADVKAQEKMVAMQTKLQTEALKQAAAQSAIDAQTTTQKIVVYSVAGLAAVLVGGIIIYAIAKKRGK
jgi:hypothetical protein